MKAIIFILLLFAKISTGFSQDPDYVIQYNSLVSLYIGVYNDSGSIGTATGFVAKVEDKFYLITNWHVVTNREFNKKGKPLKQGGAPTKLAVYYNGDSLLSYASKWENLYIDGEPRFRICGYMPDGKDSSKVDTSDVVFIPINEYKNTKFYPVYLDSLLLPEKALPLIEPMTEVFIVGFPKAQRSYNFIGIYKRGTIASEYNLPYNNSPSFLVDATARPGMSGSPVYFHAKGNYLTKHKGFIQKTGSTSVFLGVYAAQDTLTEIGVVWRADFITGAIKNYLNYLKTKK